MPALEKRVLPMNQITNKVLARINRLKKSIDKSEKELERYQAMADQIKKYTILHFGTDTFTISHPTIHYLKGIIKVQKGKLKLLQECINMPKNQDDVKKK